MSRHVELGNYPDSTVTRVSDDLSDLRVSTQTGLVVEELISVPGEATSKPVGLSVETDSADAEDWLTDLKPEQPLASQPEDLAEGDTDPDITLPVGRAPATSVTQDMDEVLSPIPMSGESAKSLDDLFVGELAAAPIPAAPPDPPS